MAGGKTAPALAEGGRPRPAAFADSGDTVVFETWDCYKGQLLEEGKGFEDIDRRLANSGNGPPVCAGAMPGDCRKAEILELPMEPVFSQPPGLSPLDAGLCLDMAGNLAVCQMVKTYKTVRMEVGKEVLREKGGGIFGLAERKP